MACKIRILLPLSERYAVLLEPSMNVILAVTLGVSAMLRLNDFLLVNGSLNNFPWISLWPHKFIYSSGLILQYSSVARNSDVTTSPAEAFSNSKLVPFKASFV